ncbi:MAG: cupredoxin domain-containing protein [Pseudonocardiaceae bacterium]
MRQFRTKFVVPAVAAGIMALAGCGGAATAAPAPADQAMPGMSGMSMPSAGSAPAASAPVASAPTAPVATNAVSILNFAFSPATVTIKAGTTVTWTNQDQDAHTVSAMSGAFHSATLNTGQSYSHTFTTPGRFDYLCTIHPFMLGTVVVTP